MAAMQAGPSGTSGGAGWDEQIVPALRKRLESESAYLSNRMSGASFPETLGPVESTRRSDASRTRTNSSRYTAEPEPVRPAHVSPPAGASRSAPRSSRIPMRPRSKSNLSSSTRPEVEPPPPLPQLPPSRSGRGSPDLKALDDVQLKDELPPFRLRSDEAMRIAENGHYLFDSDEEADILAQAQVQRKRRETMRQTGSGSGDQRPNTGTRERKASGMARSATGNVGLGLGSPPNSNHAMPSARASSSRPARALQPPTSAGSSSTPRSASMNMLAGSGHSPSSASSARLGMAAHLVPPESTYTPPKGQNWDEVVLPTVAKKLGLNDSSFGSGSNTSDGDLAVEWDTSGTPVKWIKKESVTRLGGPSSALKIKDHTGLPTDDYITRTPTPNRSGKSAFSPSFEPSPDNPLAPLPLAPAVRHRPSQNSLGSGIGTPIRTSSGQYTPLGGPGRASPPPSPAPFSQMQPNPNPNPYPPVRPIPSQSSLGRKNSTLLRKPAPTLSPAESVTDPRLGQRGGPGDRYFSHPRPAPLAQGSAVYDGQTRPGPPGPSLPPAGQTGNGKRQKGDGDHGKGCGCIIM